MSHLDVKRVAVALAVAADTDLDRQLSVGGLLAAGDGHDDGDGNVLRSLLEIIAYMAEVLRVELDQLYDEEFVETSHDGAADVLGLRFSDDVRPVVCVVCDANHAYVVAVSPDTGDTTVRFGDGTQGKRPPEGFENIAATYRAGEGSGGNLEVRGLGLSEPFEVIAISHRGRRVRSAWQVYPPVCRK